MRADVVICGAGLAGVAAARAAVEAGASVILFEKSDRVNGRSGQFGVIGGELMKHWGKSDPDVVNEIVDQLMRQGGYRVKQRILKRALEESGPAFDWYLEGYPEYDIYDKCTDIHEKTDRPGLMLLQYPNQPLYNRDEERYPCFQYTVEIQPTHLKVLKGNHELAEKSGLLRTVFKTPVKKLLKDDTGRVTGVIAKSYEGKVIRAHAEKGVILSTGDYANNPDMREYYTPWVRGCRTIPCGIDPERNPCNTGDGHKMGLWAGARMEAQPHCVQSHNMGNSMGVAPFLQLDAYGERFMNEDCTGQQVENQLERVKDHVSWQIYDSNWPSQIPHMPAGHGQPSQLKPAGRKYSYPMFPADGFASQEHIDACVKDGSLIKADTLEELIEKAGLPKEKALASIERYNELARKGNDDDFGKRANRLFPIEKAPFYADKLGLTLLLVTFSGLESDHEAHVLDEEFTPIPGLYCAGNVQGGRASVDYPTTLPGISHTLCLTYGRIAGRNAAQGK